MTRTMITFRFESFTLRNLKEGTDEPAAERRTVVVADVREFPGHIACDAASRSEIVVPLICATTLIGVLDIDSPRPARFDSADASGIEQLAALFTTANPDAPGALARR